MQNDFVFIPGKKYRRLKQGISPSSTDLPVGYVGRLASVDVYNTYQYLNFEGGKLACAYDLLHEDWELVEEETGLFETKRTLVSGRHDRLEIDTSHSDVVRDYEVVIRLTGDIFKAPELRKLIGQLTEIAEFLEEK